MHLPQVIHTPWDDADSQYKLIGYDYSIDGFHGATSPDGIHWTDVEGQELFSNRGDVGNFVWDPHEGRYMATPKIAASVRGFTRRCVGSAVTDGDDFTDWSTPMLTLVPDELRRLLDGRRRPTDGVLRLERLCVRIGATSVSCGFSTSPTAGTTVRSTPNSSAAATAFIGHGRKPVRRGIASRFCRSARPVRGTTE